MSSIPEYHRGYRNGMKAAVQWLSRHAEGMNDPHAKAVLNVAAAHLGAQLAKVKEQSRKIVGQVLSDAGKEPGG